MGHLGAAVSILFWASVGSECALFSWFSGSHSLCRLCNIVSSGQNSDVHTRYPQRRSSCRIHKQTNPPQQPRVRHDSHHTSKIHPETSYTQSYPTAYVLHGKTKVAVGHFDYSGLKSRHSSVTSADLVMRYWVARVGRSVEIGHMGRARVILRTCALTNSNRTRRQATSPQPSHHTTASYVD